MDREHLLKYVETKLDKTSTDGHWYWEGYYYKGKYPQLSLRVEGKPRNIQVRGILLNEFKRQHQSNCGDARCVNPEHLVLKERTSRRLKFQRCATEIKSRRADFIRQLHSEGYTEGEIANGVGITVSAVSLIINNKRHQVLP